MTSKRDRYAQYPHTKHSIEWEVVWCKFASITQSCKRAHVEHTDTHVNPTRPHHKIIHRKLQRITPMWESNTPGASCFYRHMTRTHVDPTYHTPYHTFQTTPHLPDHTSQTTPNPSPHATLPRVWHTHGCRSGTSGGRRASLMMRAVCWMRPAPSSRSQAWPCKTAASPRYVPLSSALSPCPMRVPARTISVRSW